MSLNGRNSSSPIFTVMGEVYVQERHSEGDDDYDTNDGPRSLVANRVGSWLSEG